MTLAPYFVPQWVRSSGADALCSMNLLSRKYANARAGVYGLRRKPYWISIDVMLRQTDKTMHPT